MGLPQAVQNSEILEHTVPTVRRDREVVFTIVGDKQSADISDLADSAAEPAAHAVFKTGVAAFKSENYETALGAFRAAAADGDVRAQYNLGIMFDNGYGVQQNYTEAADWYRVAAEAGYADAQYNLGAMYGYGHGVPRDHAKAERWYRAAAEQGDADAQYSLGVMYNCGEGVVQDLPFAHMWFSLAIATMSPGEDRGKVVKIRETTVADMTPAEIAEAELLQREWRQSYGAK
jgi:TPR repeat protein